VIHLLDAVKISKRFDGITALCDVSVCLERGEVVALIGPNGAGKTTLFNCLTGVLRPDDGAVMFDGRDLGGLAPYQRSRLGLGRTFQQIELFTGLTVLEHLLVADRAQRCRSALGRDLTGRSAPTGEELSRCRSVLDLVGLGGDADRPAESLSLGRGRVVELARALVCEPRLLFLDEPSSGLGAQETADMAAVLQQVRTQRDLAILLCEHDVPFVERLATRTYVLDSGRLIAEGPTAEALGQPVVRRAYLGVGAQAHPL
jgi:ABC-type branched-subunit amino acid transport system ATPase component